MSKKEIFVFGIFLGFIIGMLLGLVVCQTNNNEETDTSLQEEFKCVRDPYLIVDDKLYYNTYCNGMQQIVFITEVDKQKDQLYVVGFSYDYAKKFPIVMVDGKLKMFILKGAKDVENYTEFYVVNEILVEEISVDEEEDVWVSNVTFPATMEDDMVTQYIQIEFGAVSKNNLWIIVKEDLDPNLDIKNEYIMKSKEVKFQHYDSYKEAYELVKAYIFNE